MLGLGAGIVGGLLLNQGAQALEDVRGRRLEQREGDVIIFREPGRVIVQEDDRIFIQRDEAERFRDLGLVTRSERLGSEVVTIFDRPDGTQIVTVTDEFGRLLRRSRRSSDGRDIIIIENQRRDLGDPRFADEVVLLPPPPLTIPQDRYVVDAEMADEATIYNTLTAPPIARVPRRYTLDEIRYSKDLRAHMRSVDVDTITFQPGSWTVAPDQIRRLATLAAGVRKAVTESPSEVFLVEGHTDAVGNAVDNVSLSDRRAQAVAEILNRDFAIPPENLTIQGYGQQQLKVQTQGPELRNRRVTLRRITPLLNGQPAQ